MELKQCTFNSTKDLDERCRKIAEQYKLELIERRKQGRSSSGRQSPLSEFIRQALEFACDTIEDTGKLI